uniref:Uncharacterized protein n=1 Tax=Oryza meridionalis TaxID=40149 RepID=A0A0E0C955_9ORYZ
MLAVVGRRDAEREEDTGVLTAPRAEGGGRRRPSWQCGVKREDDTGGGGVGRPEREDQMRHNRWSSREPAMRRRHWARCRPSGSAASHHSQFAPRKTGAKEEINSRKKQLCGGRQSLSVGLWLWQSNALSLRIIDAEATELLEKLNEKETCRVHAQDHAKIMERTFAANR